MFMAFWRRLARITNLIFISSSAQAVHHSHQIAPFVYSFCFGSLLAFPYMQSRKFDNYQSNIICMHPFHYSFPHQLTHSNFNCTSRRCKSEKAVTFYKPIRFFFFFSIQLETSTWTFAFFLVLEVHDNAHQSTGQSFCSHVERT